MLLETTWKEWRTAADNYEMGSSGKRAGSSDKWERGEVSNRPFLGHLHVLQAVEPYYDGPQGSVLLPVPEGIGTPPNSLHFW